MKKSVIKAAILGGIIVFAWNMLSWMVLPWHKDAMKQFANPEEVSKVIAQNAPENGMYCLPKMCQKNGLCTQENLMNMHESRSKGLGSPNAMVTVKYDGMNYLSPTPYVCALVLQIIGAFIIGSLLFHTKGLSFRGKVGFVTLIGLTVGLLGSLPKWIWMGAPFSDTLLCIIDLVIAWTLAGLVLAKFIKPGSRT